jgi:hypothetical protein
MDSEDIVRKCHQKRGRIRDPEKINPGSGSRIQGVKKHRIRIRNTGIHSFFDYSHGRPYRIENILFIMASSYTRMPFM